MKKIILHIFLFISGLIFAQTTTPDLLVTIQKASQLEIDNYTNTELELGMLVYNTDENRIYEYTTQGWLKLLTEIDNSNFTYTDVYNNSNSGLTINENSNGIIIPFNTIRLQNGLPNLSNNQIEIMETGVYEISYTIALEKASNSQNNTLEIIVCENNIPMPNTGSVISFQQANNNNGNRNGNGNGNGNNGNGNGNNGNGNGNNGNGNGNNGNGNGNNGNGNNGNGNGNGGNTENFTSASRSVLLDLNQGNNYGIKLRGMNFSTNDSIDVTVLSQVSGMSVRKVN